VARQIRAAGGRVWKVTLDENGELEFAACGLTRKGS
jgi:hypothetical protein